MSSILKEITEYNPGLQELKQELNRAVTLKAMALTGFKIGMATAVLIIEETLADRAYNTVDRPVCPKCKTSLESKGRLPRAVMTVIGYIAWKRKVRRCPNGCRTGQTAPFDSELGLRPNQRTGDDIKQIACVPAVFLPFNIAALLLKTLLGTEVSPSAVWNWTQYAGKEATATKIIEAACYSHALQKMGRLIRTKKVFNQTVRLLHLSSFQKTSFRGILHNQQVVIFCHEEACA